MDALTPRNPLHLHKTNGSPLFCGFHPYPLAIQSAWIVFIIHTCPSPSPSSSSSSRYAILRSYFDSLHLSPSVYVLAIHAFHDSISRDCHTEHKHVPSRKGQSNVPSCSNFLAPYRVETHTRWRREEKILCRPI